MSRHYGTTAAAQGFRKAAIPDAGKRLQQKFMLEWQNIGIDAAAAT
ncbi:hypothetical protein U5A82_20595 [Sphingobium sp. CR2-8]|nr:hypothetical protein [Sphingobium sp. CR2-8]MEC3912783.1 hypothetical protein [Sphingobium sp. CR2-8]